MNVKALISVACFSLSLAVVQPVAASTTHYGMGPIAHIAPHLQRIFTCIIWRESRSTWSHPNVLDVSRYGSSGIFQMEPVLWNRWSSKAGVRSPLWRATVLEQEQVAVEVYRHDGFSPWKDGCA